MSDSPRSSDPADFERLVKELVAFGVEAEEQARELDEGSDPRRLAHAALDEEIDASIPRVDFAAFVPWLQGHDAYAFVVWELQGRVCAKPNEIGPALLGALVRDLVDDALFRRERAPGASVSSAGDDDGDDGAGTSKPTLH